MMVPWGTGNPISSGYLNTLVFLTEKPPPLSISVGDGSMSPIKERKNILNKLVAFYRQIDISFKCFAVEKKHLENDIFI